MTDTEGNTALHLAALNGRDHATESMIQLGASVEVRNFHGQTPLHIASSRGFLKTVKALVRQGGAYADSEDDSGVRPISIAARNGHAAVVQFLLSEMAMLDQPSYDERTPLMEAVTNNHVSVAKTLLEAGAGVHLVDDAGNTALHLAVRQGQAEMVALLLEYDADSMTENDALQTVRDIAICMDNAEIIHLLQENNDSPNTNEADLLDDVISGITEGLVIQGKKRDAGWDLRNEDPVVAQLVNCPITMDVMQDPVMAVDGYCYERTAITAWLRSHGTSPVTKQPMSLECLIPNRALKYFIQEQTKAGQ